MYRKIISNFAFSPSSIDQVSFYARRLKQEESVRRLGLVLIVFSMFIQVFAAMIPPEKSLAASGNDVIRGGVSSIDELRTKYHNQEDVKGLYNRFGVTAGDLQKGKVDNVSFNFQQQGARGTKTVGRINFASTKDHNLGTFAGTTFYSRSAAEWQGSSPAYYLGKHKGTDNRYYLIWVIKDCGNIAYRRVDAPDKPAPPPPPTPAPTPTPPPATPPPAPAPTPTPAPTRTPPPAPPVKPANIDLKKSAINLTQNLTPAQTLATPAKAGDEIEYTLIVKTDSDTDVKDYVVVDYIGDILDYADLDRNFLISQGGDLTPEKEVKWSKQTVPANGSLVKVFRVKLKAVLPSTNTPSATATEYDCKMQNGFGNEIVIMVQCPVLKTVETLPNTGPGTTIAAALGVVVVSSYFYMRSRLLAKEVGIIKRSYQSGH